ncbi:ABC transporter family substrate-binding protein [Pseudonocardia nigra]|uniref:ABC transporter family substrate-binding protein n=1 Tax=Pseudonocardia nigra TaxID=1921578 RepID=UPI001C5F0805|nr:ABC transporter family substrate-binding protein [Pseudonocardia nigra]
MLRVGRAALALVLALLLAACTNEAVPPPTPEPTPQPEPTELVVGVDDLGGGFNPHLLAHLSPVTTALATLVLPSVFRPDAQGVMHLDETIATSAEVVETEPFTVSYELNLEASWSSNAPIAAEDFVYLWERMRSEPGVADAAGYRLITEVRSRAGGKAVDVVFAEPYPAWQHLFSDLLPAHILKDAPGSWTGALANGLPASGGPFRIESVDRARGEVVLARNDLYWDTPTVLDKLVFRSLDDTVLAAGLASGDVDIALPEADPTIRTALGGVVPPPTLQLAPRPVVTQLGMRADAGPMADPRARQGIAAIVDREAVRTTVAPEALPPDAFGLAPSQPGYASTVPADAPIGPNPEAAAQLLASAGWTRDLTTGRWAADGEPVRLVLGAAAERPEDVRVAHAVAEQLDAAGIDVTVVTPSAVELFGQETVPPVVPTPTATPTPSAAPTSTPPTSSAGQPTSATPVPGAAGGTVEVDLMVVPRTVGGDPGTELASDYGCPLPNAVVPEPPRSPTGFCFGALQPLLDELVATTPRPEVAEVVERVLWAQMPALPLFQPVTLVVSTPTSDAVTGIGPGPILTGPVTGAAFWRNPNE